jgi:superfamily II DNA or RNA helicase
MYNSDIIFGFMDSSTLTRTISYLPEFHVFLCQVCCVGVRRSQFTSHFRIQHRFTSVQLKALNLFCGSIVPDSDVRSIETVPLYVETAITGLPVLPNGLLCQIDRTKCRYICRSSEKMRKHCQQTHRWQRKTDRGRPSTAARATLPALPWILVRCQRLFTSGANSHYFEVRTTDQTVETSTSEVWEQMETAVQQAQKDLTDKIRDDAHDISPWLRRARWAEILSGLTRAQLLGYIQEPDPQEESDEIRLWIAVRQLIEHCQQTVMKSGHFVRTQMVQTERTSRPLQPLQAYFRRPDLLKSCRYWQQILLFFVRSQSDESVRSPYELTSIQQRSLQRVQEHLRTERTEARSDRGRQQDSLSILEQACLDFCFSLLHHRLRTDEYESALVFALAVLGLTEQGFRGPHDYPSMLSGLIKTSRFMMTQVAVRPSECTQDFFYDLGTEVQPDQHTISRTEQIVQEFMVRGSQSPMQWMLDLRSYGMKIAFNTTAEGEMNWVGDQVVFQNLQFTMSEFRAFVHGLTYETEHLLLGDLLFTRTISKPLPTIDLVQIKDNVIDRRTGWNFLQDIRNPSLVDGAVWMRERIYSHAGLRTTFLPDHINPNLPPSSVQTYLASVRTFLTKLLLLIHITGGQPARIPEILTVRHRNSSHDEPRNIFVEDGLVTFVTRYHKGYTISGEHKIIHRHLPHQVSLIVVQYLWLVLPLVERLESFYCSSYELSAFLWPGPPRPCLTGTWDPYDVRRALQKESRIGLGQTLNIQSYRHLAIGMSRRFLTPGHHFSDEDRTEELIDRTEEEIEQEVLDQQAAHSSYVAGAIYARGLTERPGEIWSQRQRFRRISIQWHQFLGFSSVRHTNPGFSHKRVASSDLEAVNTHHRRLSMLRTMSVDSQLHRLFGSGTSFRTIQRSALQAIVRRDSPILTIMPTGGGKSLLFLLPASYEMSGTTVVIVPLISLRADVVRRCRELSISCRVWNARQPADGAKIVLVTPEGAVTSAFANFLNRLRTIRQLDRIVLDECHLVLDNTSFRTAFDQLHQLSRTEVPLVFLSATLPPSRESDFWQRLTLSRVPHHIFRTTTLRSNLRYSVTSLPSMSVVIQRAKSIIAQTPVGRIIVYGLDVRTVEQLADLFEAVRYHSRYAKKEDALQQFMSGQCRTIVATSALGLGIDLADVRAVIHIEAPRNLLDYAQESGRAGRDGEISEAVILQSQTAVGSVQGQDADLQRYLTAHCRRTVLNAYLDGDAVSDRCTAAMALCDLCTARQSWPSMVRSGSSSPGRSLRESELVRTRQGGFVRQEGQEEIKEQSVNLERGLRLLQGFHDQCMLCISVHSRRHPVATCTAPDRASYEEMVQLIRRRIRYDRFSGCFRCGVPQSLCRRWIPTDRGFRTRPDTECQFSTSLSEAAAVFLHDNPHFTSVQKRIGARFQIDSTTTISRTSWQEKIIRQLGRKVRWLETETNVLFQEILGYYLTVE